MTNADLHPLADVAFVMSWARRSVYTEIARRLKQNYGSRVHVYVAEQVEAESLRKQDTEGVWTTVGHWNMLNKSIARTDLEESDVVDRARQFEDRLGETMNRLSLSHRQLGRGFSPGSYHYPRSPLFDGASYLQMLHAFNESLAFWEKEISEKGLQLIIDGEKLVAAVARMSGIPFRRMIGSRYKNYWFWTPDEYQSNPKIKQIFDTLTDWQDAELTDGYVISASRSAGYHKRVELPTVLRRAATSAAHYAWWKLRGSENASNFTFLDLITIPFGERQRYRKVRKIAQAKLDEIADSPFVYFPLHKEPETSFLIRSPDFTNQHAAIIAIARDLPAGIRLAVKENLLSIGARPSHFLEQLADLKNVVLLDVHEDGIEAVRRSQFVATITGTAGLEAASIGKPVLTFTPYVTYTFLDHVRVINRELDLRPAIEWALDRTPEQERAAARDGARFLKALTDASFDTGDYGSALGIKRFEDISDDSFEALYAALLDSLPEGWSEPSALNRVSQSI